MLPMIDRRRFLSVGALTATVPGFLARTGKLFGEEPKSLADRTGRVLVVVQLAGGNDGLNTLIPFKNDAYYKARPKLAVAKEKGLKLTDEFALHPETGDLRKLHDAGCLGIITNVGYPNPNRSHFRATEIWETGIPEKDALTGWVGRYFDNECRGVASPMLGLQLGEKPAMTFAHARSRAVTLTNPSLFRWDGGVSGKAMGRLNRVQETDNDQLDFLQRTGNDTLTLSRKIQDALKDTKTAAEYAPFNFSQSLKVSADAADGPLRVRGDLSHLQQAVENLLFNARDATFEMRNHLREEARKDQTADRKQRLIEAAGWKGEVRLSARRTPAGVVLEVRDNGIGMTEEVRANCMRTHYTTKRDNALYEGYSAGMGLGLSFVAMVLEYHGAKLEVESGPLNGATFRIVFPAS